MSACRRFLRAWRPGDNPPYRTSSTRLSSASHWRGLVGVARGTPRVAQQLPLRRWSCDLLGAWSVCASGSGSRSLGVSASVMIVDWQEDGAPDAAGVEGDGPVQITRHVEGQMILKRSRWCMVFAGRALNYESRATLEDRLRCRTSGRT